MRPKLTYANVMATVAVFIAMGGMSYAALKLPKNSVGAKQLKKNAVTTAKIKNEAVAGAKVKKGTLTGTQINASTLAKVPAAANADAVGGVGLSGLLRSDHILTGNALATSTGGNFVLRDNRTGAEVLTGEVGRLRLVNTSSTDTIHVDGLGYFGTTEAHVTRFTIAPGAHVDVVYDATSFAYGQYILMREPGNVSLQLTCSENTTGSGTMMSCVAVG